MQNLKMLQTYTYVTKKMALEQIIVIVIDNVEVDNREVEIDLEVDVYYEIVYIFIEEANAD